MGKLNPERGNDLLKITQASTQQSQDLNPGSLTLFGGEGTRDLLDMQIKYSGMQEIPKGQRNSITLRLEEGKRMVFLVPVSADP